MSNLNTNNTLVGMDVLDDTLELGNLRVIPKTLHRREMSALRSLISQIRRVSFTMSSGEIRPSGTTAVASTMMLPHPRKAMLPRWTK